MGKKKTQVKKVGVGLDESTDQLQSFNEDIGRIKTLMVGLRDSLVTMWK